MKNLLKLLVVATVVFGAVLLGLLTYRVVNQWRSGYIEANYWIDDELNLGFQRRVWSVYDNHNSSLYLLQRKGTANDWEVLGPVGQNGVLVTQNIGIVVLEEEGDFERNHETFYGLVCVPRSLSDRNEVLNYAKMSESIRVVDEFDSEMQKISIPCY